MRWRSDFDLSEIIVGEVGELAAETEGERLPSLAEFLEELRREGTDGHWLD